MSLINRYVKYERARRDPDPDLTMGWLWATPTATGRRRAAHRGRTNDSRNDVGRAVGVRGSRGRVRSAVLEGRRPRRRRERGEGGLLARAVRLARLRAGPAPRVSGRLLSHV